MTEIEALLAAHGQELAFEPMDPARLWRGNSAGTLGGTIAVNAGGPRRIKAGAARDHVLGFRAVTGRGDVIKSGGRVVKNVTGYDLSKLIAGSHGTLAVMTEITLKVLPKAETERTLLLRLDSEAACLAALREASGLSQEVSSYACLPDGGWLDLPPGPCALMRLEGPGVSVDKRFADLEALFGPRGRADDLGEGASRRVWSDIRDAAPIADAEGLVWKISTAPTAGAALIEALRRGGAPLKRWYYDWAGGLVWLALDGADAMAETIRAPLARLGGHATLMRADDATRARATIFQPQAPALAALSRRVKASFDPLDILNRGRLGLQA
jgi:glycolate oxidase FAD binding subunit